MGYLGASVSSQDSMGGSPNDIRISDMRPTLVEPPMYKPKVVLLGKDKKGMLYMCSGTRREAQKHTSLDTVIECEIV